VSLRFEIKGKPVAWKRSRVNGKRHFTDPQVAAYKRRIILEAKMAGAVVLEGPVRMEIIASWKCPKSFHRKRLQYDGGWKDPRPDVDNVAKLLLDAMNGVCYVDDGQVADLRVRTLWARQGECGRVVVEVSSMS